MRDKLRHRMRQAAVVTASTALAMTALTIGSASAQPCEDCEPGGGTGGGTSTPVVYRHVGLEGWMHLYDHEGGNSYTRCEGSGGDYFRYELQAPVGQWTTSKRHSFCGGEIRLETTIDVRPNANGTLDYRGSQLLYEGTSTSTNDLDGKTTIAQRGPVPAGATTGFDVANKNGSEQGHINFEFGHVDDTFTVSFDWVHDESDPTDHTVSRFRIHNF